MSVESKAVPAPGVSARPVISLGLELSVVAPVFDEAPNLVPLAASVSAALGEGLGWELILVDDGSRDGSAEAIRELARRDPRVRGVFLARHSGQTSALKVGIERARAPLIVTLDADLQNDPADIKKLLARLEGHEAVVGVRVRRQDSFVRRVSSRIANRVRNAVLHDTIQDTGCGLKLFRTEAIRTLPLFEGMHRFLPTLLRYHDYSVIEVPVSHHPRTRGRSKYGIRNRAWRAFKDMLAVRWMRSRIVRVPSVLSDERNDEAST
jgi:glycosyltransferase involved in cell wall biosynthesis